MIWPTYKLVKALMLPCLLSFLVVPWPTIWPLVAMLDGLVLTIALIDIFTLVLRRRWHAGRSKMPILSIGKPQTVSIEVENRNRYPAQVQVVDFTPQELSVESQDLNGTIPPRRKGHWTYTATPKKRGCFVFPAIQVLISSRLGFWLLDRKIQCETEVRVYPDVHQISEYSLLARRHRLSILGVRKARKIGSDNEFEQLRDYVPGDDPRHLDWRATARRRNLTVRSYQANQSQRIMFLIDSGRMMAGDVGDGLSPLDHAFNAMILLAHVALLKGDQVGLVVFSDRLRAFIPPEGGTRQLGKLIHAIHDIHPETVESRFDRAFAELKSRCRRRGLVVFMTNLFDEFHANWAADSLKGLVGQHVPLAVFLRQADLMELADQGLALLDKTKDKSMIEALGASTAAADLLNHRHDLLNRLRHDGAFVLDLDPREITAKLINQYLEIKAKQLI